MSAWVVSKAHVDALVQASVMDGLTTFPEATELGRTLWAENWHSVNTRYEGRYPEDRPDIEGYHFEGIEAPLDDAKVYTLVRCYQYQCAEWDGYEREPGYKLMDALAERIKARTPSADGSGGPWGIDSLVEAVAS